MRIRAAFVLLALAIGLAASGCSMLSETASVPAKHPEELAGGRADCNECHTDLSSGAMKPYASFKHTEPFLRQHGFYARQGQNLCSGCHSPAYCAECHARRPEMTPATRNAERPDRSLPHRGDYLVAHRLDGRMNPGSCVPCHGNRASGSCRACHR